MALRSGGGTIQKHSYIVAATHSWNRLIFEQNIASLDGNWSLINSNNQLTKTLVDDVNPAYIFFLHWSWKVPLDIIENYCCINFHMTDLPYGRGGSPLQNLIVRGHQSTKLTALKMTSELDAGPIYMKCNLSLSGRAQNIYERSSRLAAGMMRRIISEQPQPTAQSGPITTFKRRRPEQSRLPHIDEPARLYDFIRMLDAEGYPKAFMQHAGARYEFSHATLSNEGVSAKVFVKPEPDKAT